MSNPIKNSLSETDDDYPLVLACRKGDVEAFGTLVEKYQKRILNAAYRMIGDYEEACETVQETFLSAYKAIGKFRGDASFSTWLYGICLNHARNRLKQHRQSAMHRGPSLDDPDTVEDGMASQAAVDDPPPDEKLEKKELQEKVQACINALDADHREVLILRDIQGMSYEEIGAVLKLSDGTVKSRLFRARDALRIHLTKIMGEL